MADASRPPSSPPPGWGELFAALPLESPPASRWPQIEARLDTHAPVSTPISTGNARGARRMRPALAAGLCALALLPFAWWMSDRTDGAIRPNLQTTSSRLSTPPPAVPSQTMVEMPTTTGVGEAFVSVAAATAPPPRSQHRPRTSRPQVAKINETTPTFARGPTEETLESLYSASAQLESLLTLTRDTRVQSGPAAALASDFDAELALIDARLAEPGLDAIEQRSLWRARVDALQQANSFEANQRVLSAQGLRYEGALVSVD
jgi:hypothetical protein